MTAARTPPTDATAGPADTPTRRTRLGRLGIAAALALALGLGGVFAGPAAAGALTVTIDTTTLAGATGELDFLLLDGDFTANNTVTVSDLATDGTFGTQTCVLGCVGAAPPPYTLPHTIDDSAVLGQLLQEITLGTFVSFKLAFTTNFDNSNPGSAPDRFTLNLYDSSGTMVDTDLDFLSDPVPAQDALLLIDLVGNGLVKVPAVTNPRIPVTAVPEPGTLLLAALGLLALAMGGTAARRERV